MTDPAIGRRGLWTLTFRVAGTGAADILRTARLAGAKRRTNLGA